MAEAPFMGRGTRSQSRQISRTRRTAAAGTSR
jgi:hypothetical protein